VEVGAGKVERALAVSPFVESGNVFLPHPSVASWVDHAPTPKDQSWLEEVTTFPNAKHNDRVDAMTQALMWWHAGGAQSAVERLRNLGQM